MLSGLSGLSGLSAVSGGAAAWTPGVPPEPTAGQALVWRADFDSTTTIDSGSPSNFDLVSGTAYSRKGGPRYGPAGDASWTTREGWSARVPVTGFLGRVALGDATQCGMLCGWFRFSPRGTAQRRTVFQVTRGVDFAPYAGLTMRTLDPASDALTFGLYNAFTGHTNAVSPAGASCCKWVYLCVAWEKTVPNLTWRGYYSLDGETVTLIGEQSDTGGANIVSLAQLCSVVDEDGAGGGWSGGAGGVSLYALDALDDAATYPADLVKPSDSPITWRVASTGDDAGDGIVTPWLSGAKVQTEILRGTIFQAPRAAAVTTAAGVPVDARARASVAACYADADAYLAGDRLWVGDTIRVTGRVETSARWGLEDRPGVQVRIDAGAKLTTRRALAGPFTRPDATNYPLVWQAAGDDYGGIAVPGVGGTCGTAVYQGGVLSTPQYAADLAAALPLVNGGANRCWADGDGVYFTTAAGTDPNADGVSRETTYVLATNPGTGAGVVALGVGRVFGSGSTSVIETGAVVVMTGGLGQATIPQYCVSQAGAGHAVEESVALHGGSYHADGGIEAGPSASQICQRRAVTVVGSTGGSIPHVTYSSVESTDADTIQVGVWDDCAMDLSDGWHGFGEAVGVTATGEVLYAHSNGAFLGTMAALVRDCNWPAGGINLSYHPDAAVSGSTLQFFQTDHPGATVDDCVLTCGYVRTIGTSDITVTDSTLECTGPEAGMYNGAVPQNGPVTITNSIIDYTDAPSGRVLTLLDADAGQLQTVTGCDITLGTRLLAAVDSAADLVMSGNTFHGSASDVIATINGVNKTLAQLVTAGSDDGTSTIS